MIKKILKKNIKTLIKIFFLTLLYSGLGILTLSFINNQILTIVDFDVFVVVEFLSLLVIFLVVSIYANASLSIFGHNFVYNMRKEVVKRILDTKNSQIELIGKAKIIASLNNDIRTISFALMSVPNFIQGLFFMAATSIYLIYISPKLFLFVFVWILAMLFVGVFFMSNIHKYFKLARKSDDGLQSSFEDVVQGHKELTLNRHRASIVFDEFDNVANEKKINLIKADIYNSISDNWSNIMLLGLVGMCIFLSISLNWASLQTAITAALTILFLRTSLTSLIGSVPTLLSAKVSYEKLTSLNFVDYKDDFLPKSLLDKNWKELRFENVNFKYNDKFGLKNLNLKINRGDMIFLIGKNGSGKSTFSNLVCGLLQPSSGKIYLDDVAIGHDNLSDFQSNISAIFSDLYLFSQVIDENGDFSNEEEYTKLLNMLKIEDKVQVLNGKLSTTSLSTGQRKRLSLLVALSEKRSLLILDEWASDQDPVFKRVFYREILPYLKNQGISILAISHDDSYFDIADRILLAKDGCIRELFGEERAIASIDAVEKIS
ncbi:multidrug ABC transporter, membrane protein/ATP-binding protein [Campylobacter pinnipediorum subsp. pinnipediorum]|uniref:multidrug ABC transporter permease/ATP-binding protein n=1 Tax=Campylobacter pinnipediorum TaxID=1965231 RepID=UPI0009955937|nr:multidrug ABC transporter permease/ATP-binding protein [Campylobacter pinnipediorum]AQW83946.1 multidrug ABC transporter, membrane protein/ATP-binding protein [Campylobacter pinnipediorum subsp. pinnipediorum]